MPSTYTTNGGIELIATGEQSGTWGDTTNDNLEIIDRLTNGVGAITLSGTTHTLTTSDGALSDGQYKVLVFGGSPSGTNTVTISPNTGQHLYFVKNNSGQSIVLTQGSGGNVTVANGKSAIVYSNGGGGGAVVVDLTSTFNFGSGTVTNVATGTGLTGGPITGSGTISVDTNGITDTLLRDSVALSVIGRSANSTGDPADIAAGADHQVLRRSGTSLGFGAVALNQADAVTGTLPIGNGGTGGTTFTANNVLLGNGTSAFQAVAPGTSGNVLTSNGTTWTSAAGVSLATPLAVVGNATAGSEIRLPEDTDNGSNYVAIKAPDALAANRTMTLPDPEENATLGYLNIPQNSESAAYTLVISDAGKHILHPSADTTARTFTIPANGSVPFPVGTAVTFINQNGAGVVTIAITTDTMRLAGAGTTGSRTLAANGVATAIKITSTEWIISGVGLT